MTEGQNEMDKMTSEIEALTKAKCCLERALAEIENILYIAQECLYYREKRYGIDQCHDNVENDLILVSISDGLNCFFIDENENVDVKGIVKTFC